MRKPDFVTFTGADDWTDVADMKSLSRDFPIEWGILLEPSAQGLRQRFPSKAKIAGILDSGLRLSAHLCGGHSKRVLKGESLDLPVSLSGFERVQVNHPKPDPAAIAAFAAANGLRGIAQCRGGAFPDDERIDWLFDASGGRGIQPESWPPHPGRLAGFAGGLGPDGIEDAIAAIGAAGPFWIDMETRVRDAEGRFDARLCAKVCESAFR